MVEYKRAVLRVPHLHLVRRYFVANQRSSSVDSLRRRYDFCFVERSKTDDDLNVVIGGPRSGGVQSGLGEV